MSVLNRSNRPPERGPELFVRRLKANEQIQVVILSDKIDGFLSHWTGTVSVPCTQPVEECEGHLAGFPARWRGYLHVMNLLDGKDFFLELTKGAQDQMEIQLESESSWRGLRIFVKRMGGDASRLKVDIQAPWERVTNKPLPPAKDPENSLARLYSHKGSKRK